MPPISDSGKPGPESEAWQARLVKDLEAYDAYQRRVWGDTDDVLRARYVAGMCTEEEKARVEEAMHNYPAVHESITIVRELHAEWQALPWTLVPVKHRVHLQVPGSLAPARPPASSPKSRFGCKDS